MSTYQDPQWWNNSYNSSWDRVKAAFKRDWDQTKHDLGGDQPDTAQNVKRTVSQAAGKEPIPPRGVPTFQEREPAYRFGYGARKHYGEQFETWDAELESRLRRDWEEADLESQREWNRYRPSVRRGWDYQENQTP